MSKEERLAKDITHALGGSQNISNIIHCMTRVRIKVHNDAKVNYDELKSINGVLGVVEDERIQVVVGPGIVNKVAKLMACLLYTSPSPRDGLLSRMPSSA